MAEVVTIVDDMVTTNYLCRLFNRGVLTIMHWRQHSGLPYIRLKGEGRDAIRYNKTDVMEWARSTGKRIYRVRGTQTLQ